MLFMLCVVTLLVHLIAAVDLHIPSNGSAGSGVAVEWTRHHKEPHDWDLRIINATVGSSGDLGDKLKVEVHAKRGEKKGQAIVRFPKAGQFTVDAVIRTGPNKESTTIGTSEAIHIDDSPPPTPTNALLPGVTSETSTNVPTESATSTSTNPASLGSDGPLPQTPSSASSKSTSKTPAIIGGVIGGLAFLSLIGFIIFCFIRRRRNKQLSRRVTFHRELMVQRRDESRVSLPTSNYDLEAAMVAAMRPMADPFERPSSSASRGSTQTTRQLDIELRITKLQARILDLHNQPGNVREVEKMRRRVEWLQGQEGSPWALGLTDERPPGYDLYMTP